VRDRRPKLRLTFTSASESIEYSYVEFAILRAGSEEAEIQPVSPNLAFTLNLTLPLDPGKEAHFSLARQFAGSEVKSVEKALRVLSALREGAKITIHDLERDSLLGEMNAKVDSLEDFSSHRQLLTDVMAIEDQFSISLRVPQRISKADLAGIFFYKSLISGLPLPIDSFSATLVKGSSPTADVAIQTAKSLEVVSTLPNLPPKMQVFGTTINTGPVSLIASKAKIKDKATYWKRFSKAKPGDAVPIHHLRGIGACNHGAL
jgi:hypothetical protein